MGWEREREREREWVREWGGESKWERERQGKEREMNQIKKLKIVTCQVT